MKQFLFFLAGVVIATAVCCILFTNSARQRHEAAVNAELAAATQSVQTRLEQTEAGVANRLSAFAQSTVSDRFFALRLVADSNPAAPEVTSRASSFMGPMGFSLLDIADSSGMILSAGSYAASAGNPMGEKLARLGAVPVFIKENLLGVDLLTLQAKAPIAVTDSIRFYAAGGMTVDSAFLAQLSPRSGVAVLLRRNNSIAGWPGLRSISDVKKDRITIDGRRYPAAVIPVPVVNETAPTDLVVVVLKP